MAVVREGGERVGRGGGEKVLSVSLTDSCGMARRHKVGNSACQAQWWEFDLQVNDVTMEYEYYIIHTYKSFYKCQKFA